MALTRTWAFGMTASDTEIVLAAPTGVQVSYNLAVDGEMMRVLSVPAPTPGTNAQIGVLRGIRGTNVTAHSPGAAAVFGPPSDFAPGKAVTIRREVMSYNLPGLIANPTPGIDRIVFLNGAAALAMTLANPGKDSEGDSLVIISNTKYAHTVTITAGLGGGAGGTDVVTFPAAAQASVVLVATNETWVVLGGVTSTTANVAIA